MDNHANQPVKKSHTKLIIVLGFFIIIFLVIIAVFFYKENMDRFEGETRWCLNDSMCANYCPAAALGSKCHNISDVDARQTRWYKFCHCLYGGLVVPR